MTDTVQDVVQGIRDFLPFSPAKRGPLRDLNRLNFGGTISEGIIKGKSAIQDAMANALTVPEISFSGVGTDFSNSSGMSLDSYQGERVVLNIENMSLKDRDDAKYMAEELYRLSSRAKRGRGL